jgi:hypothetical protein
MSFYKYGAKSALSQLGLVDEEKPAWQKALPYAAGAVAAPLVYKFLRTPSFSKNPELRALQEKAQKGFHRIVDVSPHAINPKDPWYYRLADWWRPRVNTEGNLNLRNRLKLWLQEGGEAIPVASEKGRMWLPNQPTGTKRTIQGVTHGRHIELAEADKAPRDLIRGGTDVEGSHKTQTALTELGEAGKGFEAQLLQRHAPETIPETQIDIREFLKDLKTGTPKQRMDAVRVLRKRMRKAYGKDFMLKPNVGLQSAGAFPWGKQNWRKQLRHYEEHIADPTQLKALQTAENKGPGDLAAYLGEHGIEEGRILHHTLQNPENVLLQRAVQNPLGEFRVHAFAGKAPRSLMVPRYGGGIDLAKLHLGLGGISTKNLQQFAEETLAKLPEKYRTGTYGMDIMPFRKPDNSVGYKIIELNPSERAYNTASGARNMGGGSGFLDTDVMPYAGLAQYRTLTGRHATPVALAGGLGAGGLAAGTAALSTPADTT